MPYPAGAHRSSPTTYVPAPPRPTAEDSRYAQKPFDLRYYRTSVLGSAKADAYFGGAKFRGYIQGGNGVELKFLYNPHQITMRYLGDASALSADQTDPSQFGLPMGSSNTLLSFDLMFDRTFEVMDGDVLGVLTDMRTLKRMAGITADSPVMRQTPVNIGFTSPTSFHFKAILTFMEVKFIKFSQDMTPVRALISVEALRLSRQVSTTPAPKPLLPKPDILKPLRVNPSTGATY